MQTLSIKRKPKGLYSAPEKPTVTTGAKAKPEPIKAEKSAPAISPRAGVSKAVKARRKKVDRLIKHWPELFNRDQPKPLKVGIFHLLIADIEAQGIAFGAGSVKAALAGYTQSTNYLKALAAGGQRYDLTGQPAGEVTPEQQTIATATLDKRSKDNAKDS